MRRKGPRLWPVILVVLAVVAVAAAYVLVQLLRPVPAMTMAPSPAPMRALPGVPPHLAWPGRAQAAVGMPGVGLLASHGGNQPRAIASAAQPSELAGVISAAKNLLDSVSRDLERVQVVKPRTVLATVHSAWPPVRARSPPPGVSVPGWPGMPVTITVKPRPLAPTIRLG
jgi:hypothetical protein